MKVKPKRENKSSATKRTSLVAASRGFRTNFRRHFLASTMLVMCGVVSLLAVTSAYMSLKVISVSHTLRVGGVLQAIEQSTPVKHDRGGVVSNVFVTEGEVVREGQILASLNTEDLAEELQAARQSMAALLLRSRCLRALRENQSNLVVPESVKQMMGRLQQVQVMENESKRCDHELAQNQFDLALVKSELHAAQDMAELHERLVQTKLLINEIGTERLNSALTSAAQDRARLGFAKLVLEQSIKATEAKRDYDALKTRQDKAALAHVSGIDTELRKISDHLVLAQAELTRMETLMQDKFIYASTSGRVQRMRIKDAGRRIAAGAYVLEIAPLATDFEVTSRITVAQAPNLSVGQDVRVKLSGGLPKPVWVPAKIEKILKTSQNNRLLSIRLARADLNKRDLLLGDHSLNGLGEQSEAVISITSETAWESLRGTVKSIFESKKRNAQVEA
jgi:multidrug efflux pump subunit AcrA (membrane-fusion protein)